jgi:hypothetical protein
MNLWLTIAAAALAVLGWLHLLSTYIILITVFLMGVGFAFAAPAWSSIVPEIVSPKSLALPQYAIQANDNEVTKIPMGMPVNSNESATVIYFRCRLDTYALAFAGNRRGL